MIKNINTLLLTPGPVDVPDVVRAAAVLPMISHREPAFSDIYTALLAKLAALFDIDDAHGCPVIPIPSSGTGALDALCQNLITQHDRVISFSCGAFGQRFREIAQTRGAQIKSIDVKWGEAVTPQAVEKTLAEHPSDIVLLTHNETSTGVTNPIEEIMQIIKSIKNRPLVLLDAVSSAGVMPCYPSLWGIDGLASSSQKGLMSPPGVGLLWLSHVAWEKAQSFKCPAYSLDLKSFKKELLEKKQTPYTPPLSIYMNIIAALDIISAIGVPQWFAAHAKFAAALGAAFEAMGLDLLVRDKKYRSSGVTALFVGKIAGKLQKELRDMGVEIAGGQGELKDKIVRVAHYTDCGWPRLAHITGSFWGALSHVGLEPRENYLSAAMKVWRQRP